MSVAFLLLVKSVNFATMHKLIFDLALVMISAGIMTLIFKKLKQPLVLGYIVAGFLTSPHMPYTPSVSDLTDVQTWADLGVIFLLFALGLDFSFKKIVKLGSTPVIAACTIIVCMITIGYFVGTLFGWTRMDCIFLGGMLAMSSTTIIYKAFDDMGLRQQRFAGMVLSVLILEDILAIVLMVMLSTMAVSKNFEGTDMLFSILKLAFFLILWFVVGIYLIPLFLRKCKNLMSNETLLIVSLGLCFGMVVLANKAGFSPAFGAFVMGSILAETLEAEKIEHLISPVKDLFGAVFFVSVGMMISPAMVVQYIGPILGITAAILIGQTIFGTGGFVLAGQPLKTAMQCGFSLTQIGEFAFIIASLGVSLKVTSDFLYPIVVAVSVITTFLTPYMIRLSVPAYNFAQKRMSKKFLNLIDRYSSGSQMVNHENKWKALLVAIMRMTVVYTILSVAVIVLFLSFFSPMLAKWLPSFWVKGLSTVLIILFISPFLRAIVMKKNHSEEFLGLWHDNRFNRAPLVVTILLRLLIAIGLVSYVIGYFYRPSTSLLFAVALILVILMIVSRRLKKHSIELERTFKQNLHFRDMQAEYLGKQRPKYAGRLLSRDLHLSDFVIPADCSWIGKNLNILGFGKKYGVHVASIIRGNHRINIPDGDSCLYPDDKIQVIGTDEQLSRFAHEVETSIVPEDTSELERKEMTLKQFVITSDSLFLGKTIRESGIRNKFKCLIVGIERGEDSLRTPNPNMPFEEGDIVWVVGEENYIYQLFSQKQNTDNPLP